ncbi:hypothetical protein HGRIS_010775 [Hohenbuehelia grisea]|uniref:Uncharacterized protein n=1 Tax=Hohenbuehelia grisea TaxID=104357 RepID=A0ABR3IY27_9AGAR
MRPITRASASTWSSTPTAPSRPSSPSPPLSSPAMSSPPRPPRRRRFPSTVLVPLLLSSLLAKPCAAQMAKQWQWQFSTAFSDRLPSCQDLQILIKPWDIKVDNATHSVPPFYMRSFAIGGVPRTTLIGSDENNLRWTPDQPIGSKLLLNVVDSNQSSGGVPPNLYTLVAGQSTQCIKIPPSPPSFTVTANVTDTIQTCEPWGLSISGGLPPYNITLAAVNSPIITNVTLGSTDDHFTYIDRADPNSELMLAVNDATGAFASGTPIVKTAGSTNVDCVGLVSRGGNSTEIAQQVASAALAAAAAKRKRNIGIGVGVAIAALVVIALIFVNFFWWRKRQTRQKIRKEEERARRWDGGEAGSAGGGQMLDIAAFPHDAQGSPRSTKSAEAGYHLTSLSSGGGGSPHLANGTGTGLSSGVGSLGNSSVALASAHYADAGPFDPYRAHEDSAAVNSGAGAAAARPTSAGSAGSGNGNLTSRPSFAAFPTSSSRAKLSKAAEAASGHRPSSAIGAGAGPSTADSSTAFIPGSTAPAHSGTSSPPSATLTLGPSLNRGPSFNTQASGVTGVEGDVDDGTPRADEIVFQHRDGGVVRELPPPYADRGLLNGAAGAQERNAGLR